MIESFGGCFRPRIQLIDARRAVPLREYVGHPWDAGEEAISAVRDRRADPQTRAVVPPAVSLSPSAWLPARCVAAASLPSSRRNSPCRSPPVPSCSRLPCSPPPRCWLPAPAHPRPALTPRRRRPRRRQNRTIARCPRFRRRISRPAWRAFCRSPAARRRTRPKSIVVSARLRLACVHLVAGMTSQRTALRPSGAFPLLRCLLVQADLAWQASGADGLSVIPAKAGIHF